MGTRATPPAVATVAWNEAVDEGSAMLVAVTAGGEARMLGLVGLQAGPLLVLCGLAQLGQRHPGLRAASWTWFGLVLAGLADTPQVESLKAVEGSLEDAALKREAFAAYEKIAESLAARQPAAAKEALERVAEKSDDAGLRNKAKAALEKMKK